MERVYFATIGFASLNGESLESDFQGFRSFEFEPRLECVAGIAARHARKGSPFVVGQQFRDEEGGLHFHALATVSLVTVPHLPALRGDLFVAALATGEVVTFRVLAYKEGGNDFVTIERHPMGP